MNDLAELQITSVHTLTDADTRISEYPDRVFNLAAVLRGDPVWTNATYNPRRVHFVAFVPQAAMPLVVFNSFDARIDLYRADGRFASDGKPCSLDLFTREER